MVQLTDKVILITGASSGIGLATARLCAAAGMRVALAARRLDRLKEIASEINTSGGKAVALECDVSEESQCLRLAAQTLDAFGSVYAVFANAGYGVAGSVVDSTDYDIRAIFSTNFYGSLNIIRPLLPLMLEAKSGHVLMCSSCLAKIGTPYFASYSASKAAQDHYARAMRIELAGTGVHVSSVHPIGTSTEFFQTSDALSPAASPRLKTPPAFMQSPDVVGKAVVKCLRKPKGEVWTSTPTRFVLGLATMFPGIADVFIKRAVKK